MADANSDIIEFIEETVSVDIIKLSRSRAKAKFARSRHSLLGFLDESPVDRKEIRKHQEQLADSMESAMNVMEELVTIYNANRDQENIRHMCSEMDTMEAEFSSTMEHARRVLDEKADVASAQVNVSLSEAIERTQSNVPIVDYRDIGAYGGVEVPDRRQHRRTNFTSGEHIEQDLWKQLKRVSIPVFSGDKRNYESWKASFMACVDRAPTSSEYKLLQLRQYLSGEALKVIENLGHSAASYDAAKERLERKYGGVRRHIAIQMEEIDNFKPVRNSNAQDLDRFADLLDITVINMKDSERYEELRYGSLYIKLIKKMNESMLASYQRWVFEHHKKEDVETLREWILQEAEFQTIASETVKGFTDMKISLNRKVHPQSYFGESQSKESEQRTYKKDLVACAYCQGHHGIWRCKQYEQLEVSDRWNVAKYAKLCFRCLESTHLGQNCNRSRQCGLRNCSKLHHRLLHKDIIGHRNSSINPRVTTTSRSSHEGRSVVMPQTDGSLDSAERGASSDTTFVSNGNCLNTCSLRTVPVILKNGSKIIQVNALLDDGSTKTYLNADVAAELGLVAEAQQITVNVLNGKSEAFQTMQVDVQLQSLDRNVNMMICAYTTKNVTGSMEVVNWKKDCAKWPHLRNINFPVFLSRRVDMLIGLDYADLHFARKEVQGKPGQPIARLTPLGWTCVGKTSLVGAYTNFNYTYFLHEDVDEVNSTLRKFWDIEEVTATSYNELSQDDRIVLQEAKQKLYHTDGRYQVEIPWKDGHPDLQNNYEMAVRRLECTEKRLNKDQDVRSAYCKTIEQYTEKGYINKLEKINKDERRCWYLPHFPVVRADKATTKTRIVFDASATYKGESLNQTINQGPKLQQQLTNVLLRFRKNPIALVCDVAEMYLRVEIAKKDRSYFRFLWRDMDKSKDPVIYEFTRVVFGVNCSPFLAQFVAQEHARKLGDQFPLASETILNATYMDDSMDSVDSVKDGVELYRQMSELLGLADMHARKWLSNSDEVLESIPSEDQVTEMEIEGDQVIGAKTLGVIWLARDDVFTFRFKALEDGFFCSKRNVLKKVASLFDPLGFLAPYIVRAKILLQKMWSCGLDWDEPLDTELKAEVMDWFSELDDVSRVQVPRCVRLANEKLLSMSLHVFADASTEAYGAVAYARCVYESGHLSSQFVCSKTKVAPLASTSIPRLELMAAVLALRMGTNIAIPLDIRQSSINFWSDSMNVLHWIRGRSRAYKPFVANRIGEIQMSTNPDQWRHIRSEQNPADLASRGLTASRLVNETLWWNGPAFLQTPEDSWPSCPIEPVNDLSCEKRKADRHRDLTSTFLTIGNPIVDLEDRLNPDRFSDWRRLVRVQSWVLRFSSNCKSLKQERIQGELQCEEIKDAEILLIKGCQKEAFNEEYRALLQRKVLPANSKLLPLNPQLDEDGLMRSDSRLVNAEVLSYDARYPIILPRRHAITRLIVKCEHEKGAHVCGTNHILSELSKKYWILSAREAIREWEHTCMACKRRTTKAATQIMAPLPTGRLKLPSPLRSFVHTALDFAGPFLTVRGRGRSREKRYLCLFTCMKTRAVHLEMAYGLDTDSFLKAFFRFVDRRGWPEELTSDNGRNFVGANRELKELISNLDQNKVIKSTVSHRLKWNCNPPVAPHFGGVFEIMIKAAKRAVFAILGNAEVGDEELASAFIGAEALINSRPLTYQSANPQDLAPLTPSHFLHGELGRQAAPVPTEEAHHPRQRWRRVQELIRHFWSRWMQEWLPSLGSRKKWHSAKREFHVGDVVLVVRSDTARGNWPLGRIVSVHPGRDGHVRVVNVRIGETVFTRPINSLCPLEFADEGNCDD